MNLQILRGDCRAVLPTLEAGSVQCCVTSPPYWGLRDYGTAQWEGGDEGCDHLMPLNGVRDKGRNREVSGGTFHDSPLVGQIRQQFSRDCGKCGARRIDSQLGLESTIEEYIANMVAVFREVWRVLRDDGTLWLNLGDSYAGVGSQTGGTNGKESGRRADRMFKPGIAWKDIPLKSKDLCMMPARLAMALQADGWYLRSDIIWHKPNPMPESCTDRPTKSHEYIFLLTKAERYFYDAEAIREPLSEISLYQIDLYKRNGQKLELSPKGLDKTHFGDDKNLQRAGGGARGAAMENLNGRNKRTVWTIATQPYAEAHFATFPEEIPKLCILAGSKPGDTILDPFAGSGTTGQVALELGRKAILIELNPAYVELAEERTFVTPGLPL
jgi:DNA modification methylase